jgi:hypothetical protein
LNNRKRCNAKYQGDDRGIIPDEDRTAPVPNLLHKLLISINIQGAIQQETSAKFCSFQVDMLGSRWKKNTETPTYSCRFPLQENNLNFFIDTDCGFQFPSPNEAHSGLVAGDTFFSRRDFSSPSKIYTVPISTLVVRTSRIGFTDS